MMMSINNGVISSSMRSRLTAIASVKPESPQYRYTNAELLSRARTGSTPNVRSNAALALRQRIVGIVWSISGVHTGLTNEDREDITQDTLVRVITTASIVDPHPAYVRRIVENILIDRHRHAASRGLACKVGNSDEVIAFYTETVAADGEPFLVEDSVDELLLPLSVRERTVVTSRIDGKSHAEIAVSLGISSPSVRKLHERALVKLRRHCAPVPF